MAEVYSYLPQDPAVIATYDVTIVVCNFNRPGGKKGKSGLVYGPDSDQGVEMMQLCLELLKHKRAVIIIGGTGFQW